LRKPSAAEKSPQENEDRNPCPHLIRIGRESGNDPAVGR